MVLIVTFSFSNIQQSQAQDFNVNQLPVPGTMVGISSPFAPLALKGLIVNLKKPLEFQFIVDTGRGPQDTASVKDQANQLVKYFLAGITIPEGDLWVNLSPYEKKRIVPDALGQTDLGRDLLAQDYILKQLTASLIYPEKDLGKEFWSRVYAKAQEQFGTTNTPVNTFNKVWILPNEAQVFEKNNAAYVTKSTLKVMLDEDYVAKQKHQATQASSISSQIIRQIILPEIEKEVNTGKNFAPLRQIYQALILAKWYKETIQNGLLDALYTDKNKVVGVNVNDPAIKEEIYRRYLKAYKKGAFNYIKEDPTPEGQRIPRKYFSGGITKLEPDHVDTDGAMSEVKSDGEMVALEVELEKPIDTAMPSDQAMVINQAVARVQKEGLQAIGITGKVEKHEIPNFVTGMNNALNTVSSRYNTPQQRLDLEQLNIMLEENNGGPLVEIRSDVNSKPTLYIKRVALTSLPYLTIELIKVLDKYISNPMTPIQQATEEVLNNLEEILYFLNLSVSSKADFLNFVNKYINVGNKTLLMNVLLYSIAREGETLTTIYEILKDQYLWSEEDVAGIKKIVDSCNIISFNPFRVALDYTKTKSRNAIYLSELDNPRYLELANLFLENIRFLKSIKTITNPRISNNIFYEQITRDEVNATGSSPSLVILGAINLNRNNPIDAFILSRSQQLPDIKEARVGSLYLGGGGASATQIGRAIKYFNQKANKTIPDGYDNVNLVSPFDDGGSSRRDQQAIKNAYNNAWLPSPGDMGAILSWQTVSDRDWYADPNNYTIPGYSPELRNAILQLIFFDKKRVTVPLYGTLEEVIKKRIVEVVSDANLMNPHSIPANWNSFIINLKGVARVIDQELIKIGKMDAIQNVWDIESGGELKAKTQASVQNLVYLAALIATRDKNGFDIGAGMDLLHKILGINTNFALPSSTREAVLSVQLKPEEGDTAPVYIDQQTNISDLNDVKQASFPAGVTYNGIYPRPAYKMVFKKSDGNGGFELMFPNELPSVYEPDLQAIEHTENIIYTGMGSAFDSILPNLMVKGVVEALEKKKEEVPVVYFPKPTFDIQTEGLTSFSEIFEVMERSIQGLPGQEHFNMGDILTHFIVSKVSDKEVANYVVRVKRDLKQYLTAEANEKVQKSELKGNDALKFLKSIVLDNNNFNEKTRPDVESGKLKKSKLVPGVMIEFTQKDREFLQKRNIRVIEPDAEEQDDMFTYVAGKINYNSDSVARYLDKLATEHKSKYGSFIQEKERMKNPVAAKASFGRPGDNLLQVNNIDIPPFDENDPTSVRKAARFLLIEVYNRITIYGASEVKIDVNQAVFNEFMKMFYDPKETKLPDGKGYFLLGNFINMVYKNSKFTITHAEPGSLNALVSTDIKIIKKEDVVGSGGVVKGTRVGLDIGGSDLKAVVVQNGKVMAYEIVKWSPKTITNPDEMNGYFPVGHIPMIKSILHAVIKKAEAEGVSKDNLLSIGVSINLAIGNNKATGQGPVVEGLKGVNAKVMENLDTELQKEFGLPVLVLNDGKAAAIQNTVDMGLLNTLSLAGGTGLAMGYGTTDFLTEGGNIIIDVSKNALGHSFSKVPGAAQQYLSQRKAFILAEQKGIDLSRFPSEKEKFQYLQDAFEGKNLYDPKDEEKAKQIFDEYPVYLVDFIQTVASIVKVENVTLTGRIALGEAGKHVLQKAQELIREKKLNINLQFPTVPEVNRYLGEKYLEIGQAVGATYYAAYEKDKIPDMAMKAKDVGGIDLNQININHQGKIINIQFDQAQLNELMQGGFEGFTPVIVNVTYISNPFQILGINTAKRITMPPTG